MTTPNRIAYFKLEKAGFFSGGTRWKKDFCKPLNNPQARILMDKPPAGWTPPPQVAGPKIDKPKPEKKLEERPPVASKTIASDKNKDDDDACRTPPPFDMLDLPDAMEKMGFTVAAKLARRWFNGRKFILDEDATARYPADMVDTNDVTLAFVLQSEKVKRKYDELIRENIYNSAAHNAMQSKVRAFVKRIFLDQAVAFSGEIDTLDLSGRDIQKMHHDFQFQLLSISALDTLSDRYGATDLTASLGNFFLMAAIAKATIRSEKYYNHSTGTPVFCCKSSVEVTHIYAYAKDSYSFADKAGKTSSQYLGHWNRYGVILVPAAVASDLLDDISVRKHSLDLEFGNYPDEPGLMHYVYDNGFKKPVDIMNGLTRSITKKGVYYPVHNSDYNAWREKFDRGGDFAIYTDLRKIKLPTPIKISLEEICKPSKELLSN